MKKDFKRNKSLGIVMLRHNSKRWLKAQSAEKLFWQTRGHTGIPDRTFWKHMLKQSGVTFDFFKDKDILEVGCGPRGLIYIIDEARSRIGVEPMNMLHLIEEWKQKFVINAIGEKLPFDDGIFDVVICFNALDHTKEPASVIKECHRVLRDNGYLILELHALRNPYSIFRGFLNKVDSPHPCHLTVRDIKKMVENYFEIKNEKLVKGTGFSGHKKGSGSIKLLISNYLLENIWLQLRKHPL